jgi:dihydroflavonol-4-reductase
VTELRGTCAVTGAAGQIGNVLVRELVARGSRVRALVHHKHPVSLAGLEVEQLCGDLSDSLFLRHAFRDCDVVFHIAGLISVTRGKSDVLNEVNVTGTENVIRACLETGVRRLIYTGSIHAFSESPAGTPVSETLPIDPYHTIGDYGRSKARATIAVLRSLAEGLDAVVVCPTAVIGPYDYRPSKLGQFMIDIARKKTFAYISGAFDFVDVRDVAVGHILACEKGECGESYILSGEHVSVEDLIDEIMEACGVRTPRVKVPYFLAQAVALFTPFYYDIRNLEPRFTRYTLHTLRSNSFISSAKARRELGYAPRPVMRSVNDAVSWFKENGHLR